MAALKWWQEGCSSERATFGLPQELRGLATALAPPPPGASTGGGGPDLGLPAENAHELRLNLALAGLPLLCACEILIPAPAEGPGPESLPVSPGDEGGAVLCGPRHGYPADLPLSQGHEAQGAGNATAELRRSRCITC